MSEDNKNIPSLKRNISSYIKGERGQISKHKMVAMGAFLATLALLELLPESVASSSHENSVDLEWEDGDLLPRHSHHVSEVL